MTPEDGQITATETCRVFNYVSQTFLTVWSFKCECECILQKVHELVLSKVSVANMHGARVKKVSILLKYFQASDMNDYFVMLFYDWLLFRKLSSRPWEHVCVVPETWINEPAIKKNDGLWTCTKVQIKFLILNIKTCLTLAFPSKCLCARTKLKDNLLFRHQNVISKHLNFLSERKCGEWQKTDWQFSSA
jgi:hypothetical protein